MNGGRSRQKKKNRGGKKDNQNSPRSSTLEWIAAVVGLVLVLAAVGVLLYDALTRRSSAPELKISVEKTERVPEGYLVKFSVLNEGGKTAENLRLIAELLDGRSVIESSSVTLDFAPPHSKRGGGFFFRTDPGSHRLDIRAEGYESP